jgi:ribosomal protein L30E
MRQLIKDVLRAVRALTSRAYLAEALVTDLRGTNEALRAELDVHQRKDTDMADKQLTVQQLLEIRQALKADQIVIAEEAAEKAVKKGRTDQIVIAEEAAAKAAEKIAITILGVNTRVDLIEGRVAKVESNFAKAFGIWAAIVLVAGLVGNKILTLLGVKL